MIIDLKSVVCIILFSYCYSCLNNTELLAERSCFISKSVKSSAIVKDEQGHRDRLMINITVKHDFCNRFYFLFYLKK